MVNKAFYLLILTFFTLLASAQENKKPAGDFVKEAAEILQRAQAACAKKEYDSAIKEYDKTLAAYKNALKAYGKDDEKSKESVQTQIDKIKKEKDVCKMRGEVQKLITSARQKCLDRQYSQGQQDFGDAIKLLKTYEKELKAAKSKLEKEKKKDAFLDKELENVKNEIEELTKEKDKCIQPREGRLPPDQGSRRIKDTRIVIQRAIGTGNTTGHIANITISNTGNEPVKLCFSSQNSCPEDAVYIGMIYTPNKKYQDYVITGPVDFVIPPTTTFIIPATGVCVEPDKKPVPDGSPFSNPDTWIIQSDPPSSFTYDGVKIDDELPELYVTNISDVWPGINVSTDKGFTVDPAENPDLTASLIFDAMEKIDSTIKDLNNQGYYYAGPFVRESDYTSSIIRLYTTWNYIGAVTGNEYTFDDFESGILDLVDEIASETKIDTTKLKNETILVWDMITLTGVEAKIISDKPDRRTSSSREIDLPIPGIPNGCDTIRQKASAMVDLMAKMICNDVSGIMAELENLMKDYTALLNDLANLKGKKDAAQKFKDQLESMKEMALKNLNAEIDGIQNMEADDAGCAGDWQNQMLSRLGNTPANRSRVKRAERAFNNRKSSTVKNLKARLDRQQKQWDSKISNIDNQIQELNNNIDEKQKQADNIKNRLNELAERLKNQACDFKIKWDELISFMDANYKCLDCPQELFQMPDKIIRLDDCLRDLLRNLAALKNLIPAPDDEDLKRAEANAKFNPGEAQDIFDAVQKAIDAYKDHTQNGAGGSVSATSAICKGLLQWASGYQFFSSIVSPRSFGSDRGSTYGSPGSGTVAGPSDPGSLQTRAARNEYRKERNEFRKKASDLARDISKAAGTANRGYNGAPIENGFTEPENVDAHGAAEAVKHQKNNQDQLNDMINDWIAGVLNCYNKKLQQQNQKKYVELITKCLIFRQCGLALATSYGEYRDMLDDMVEENEARIKEIEDQMNRLGNSLKALDNQIAEMDNNIKEAEKVIDGLSSGLSGAAGRAAIAKQAELKSRLSKLKSDLNHLRNQRNKIQSQLEDAAKALKRATSETNRLKEPQNLNDISDAESCKREIQRIENLVRRAKDAQEGPIADNLDDAGSNLDDAKSDLEDGFAGADDLKGGISGLSSDSEDAKEELDELDRTIKDAIAARRRINCERILAEHYNKVKHKDSTEIDLESLKEAADELDELLEEIDELREILDSENEELEKRIARARGAAGKVKNTIDNIQYIRELFDRIATLWKGLQSDRALDKGEAMKAILDSAAELADLVPGYGHMIAYYAEAFSAALEGIRRIQDKIVKPFEGAADDYLKRSSICDYWLDKASDHTMDSLIEEMWKTFTKNNSIVLSGLNSENTARLKDYFKAQASMRIIECCLF